MQRAEVFRSVAGQTVAGLSEAGFFRRALLLILSIALLSGCNGAPPGPTTVEVTGTVTMDGNPVEGANVVFHPVDSATQSLASQAVTNSQGQFRLATHGGTGKFNPGIVPGKYAVAITKLDTDAISSTLAPPQNLLPKKLGDPATSGLSVDVTLGKENNFQFALDAD